MKAVLKKLPLMEVAGLTAGASAGRIIMHKVKASTNETLKKFSYAVPLIAGIVLMKMKNKLMQNAGAGMVAIGGSELVATFAPSVVPPISGVTSDDLAGLYDDYTVSGASDGVLNGTDDVLSGSEDMDGTDSDF